MLGARSVATGPLRRGRRRVRDRGRLGAARSATWSTSARDSRSGRRDRARQATASPARVDRESVSPEVQRTMASTEVSSQVAAPIVVSGRLWGATSVSLGPTDSFPPEAEERLDKFTHVVAVALANAQAREELAGLAAEQAPSAASPSPPRPSGPSACSTSCRKRWESCSARAGPRRAATPRTAQTS